MNSTERSRLNRDDVLRAALELLDEVGIDALSTRKLAERLGVQSPTLYWHFKSKGALLDAMSAAVMQRSRAPSTPGPDEDWRDWLLADGRSFRKALSIEARLRLLCAAGFEPGPATLLLMSIGRFVVGWVLEEQSMQQADAPPSATLPGPDATQYPLLAAGWAANVGGDADAVFDDALGLIVDGAAAQLA
jgi:TetR/AcrR family tetracycline transcriptional repressor